MQHHQDVRCTMYDVRCVICDVRYTIHDIRYTIHDIRCAMYDLGCLMLLKKNPGFYVERGRDICRIDFYHMLGPGRSLRYGRDEKAGLYGMYDIRCAIYDIRYTIYDIRCAMCDVRYTMYDIRCLMLLKPPVPGCLIPGLRDKPRKSVYRDLLVSAL